ncbi:MAG: aminotransferase class V-fold PLP-dependent enzyme [Bacteroidales bacterium]|nr:aminotransferase class V-fold PLP-dependent enzyme [Bacteroidales bacterium]
MNKKTTEAIAELERGVYAALETYSNVHRGSGHFSRVTTDLFEKAREVVLDYLGLSKRGYMVIFCSPGRAVKLKSLIDPKSYQSLSSQDIGLPLGIRAVVVKKRALPKGVPYETGGGSARLVSREWVIWAKPPGKFESGTPAIVNAIAFAKALLLIKQYGKDIFKNSEASSCPASEILHSDQLDQYSGKKLLDELRSTLIGRDICVPTAEGSTPFINLDNGASTPTFTPIWDAAWQAWRQSPEVQREIVGQVRSICAGYLGAPATGYDVIFTSNTTEAINLAAESLGRESNPETEPVVLNTILEHNSNELPWRFLPGGSMVRLMTDEEGFLDMNELERVLSAYNKLVEHGRKRIKLVTLSGASNVLGVCNNLSEISRITHAYGAQLAVDAAQLVAHRKVDMEKSGIDYLFFSAHKMFAPFGSGALVARKGLLNFSPEEMQQINDSGEENIIGITALGKAMVLLQRVGLDLICEEEEALTMHVINGLKKVPGISIYGMKDTDAPRFAQKGGVVAFDFKKIVSFKVAKNLALMGGIGVRYGCHCAHMLIKYLVKIPPKLEWIQGVIVTLFPHFELPGVVRVSLGIENRKEDIDKLIHVLEQIAPMSKKSPEKHPDPGLNGTSLLTMKEVKKQINGFVSERAALVYSKA